MIMSDDDRAAARALLDAGTEIAGAASGAAVGALLGGPPGAVLGAAAGATLKQGLWEFANRLLSHREQARVGGALHTAATEIESLLAAGREPRDDGFFSVAQSDSTSSFAAELLEGSLLAAQRDHEERKARHYGYLFANIAFHPEIDQSTANWIVRLGQDLTWTQLVILSIVGSGRDHSLPFTGRSEGWPTWSIREQVANLGYAQRELILPRREATKTIGVAIPAAELREQTLNNGGMLIYELMSLDRISTVVQANFVHTLNEAPGSAQ